MAGKTNPPPESSAQGVAWNLAMTSTREIDDPPPAIDRDLESAPLPRPRLRGARYRGTRSRSPAGRLPRSCTSPSSRWRR